MKALEFHSCLAPEIRRFISLRQLSGTDYHSQALLLRHFDRFLRGKKLKEPRITRQIIDDYLQTLSHLAVRSRGNRFCVVRQLCRYLWRTDPLTYVPEAIRSVPSQSVRCPYIYSVAEICALLAAASELPPSGSLRPQTYRTLLGLLYTTGIRIGEALALNLENFHSIEQRIYVAEGKFRKARWVPLSSSTFKMLQSYIAKRLLSKPGSADSPLLLNERSRRLHHCTVNRAFRGLLNRCDIKLLLCYAADTLNKSADELCVEEIDESLVLALLDMVNINSRTGVRDKALLLLLYNTGARVSEIVELKTGNMRLRGTAQITLMGKGKKPAS